jgi:GH15 family glucan-1,4-alpha-glucosidase
MAGGEGAFIMVTFWLAEAMARVGILLAVQTPLH